MKNSDVDWLLAKAAATPTGVDRMWQDLVAKHGPVPFDQEAGSRGHKRRGNNVDGRNVDKRLIGELPSAAVTQVAPRVAGELFRPSKTGSAMQHEVVRILINFTGFDSVMLDELDMEQRIAVADAMEQQLAMNGNLTTTNVNLVAFRGGDAEFELTTVQGAEHQLFHAAASLVNKAGKGSYSVKVIRSALLNSCRLNGMRVHAVAARVLKSNAKAVTSIMPPVSDPIAVARESTHLPPEPTLNISEEEAQEIKVNDAVARMDELDRMSHAWKVSLEERLGKRKVSPFRSRSRSPPQHAQQVIDADRSASINSSGAAAAGTAGGGGAGGSMTYKRNNESFKNFITSMFADTTAFSGK